MGYEGFQNGKWPYLANEIIDIMARDSLWRKTGLVFAQNKANQGYLSVAGEKKKPHGHVCVIRPGNFVYSQKWGYYCPKVMNIGSKNFMGLGLNYAFKKIPEIWVFQG